MKCESFTRVGERTHKVPQHPSPKHARRRVYALLLGDGTLQLVEIVLIGALDLVDIGLLLFQKTGDLLILLSELGEQVLRLLDYTGEVCRIL